MRFVALGDSFTEGVGDPRRGRAGFRGELEGWVEYLAVAVRASGMALDLRNLAVAGARVEHVIDQQLPRAFDAARPTADLVSCFIGINDLWGPKFEADVFAERFDTLFRRLTANAPIVMTATIHDVFEPFPIRSALREKLNRDVHDMNTVIRASADKFGLALVDLAAQPDMLSNTVKAIDRLHPNRYGHQLVAGEVLRMAQTRGLFLDVVAPAAEPIGRGVHDLAHVAWIGSYARRNWRRWRNEVELSRADRVEPTPPVGGPLDAQGEPDGPVSARKAE